MQSAPLSDWAIMKSSGHSQTEHSLQMEDRRKEVYSGYEPV